MRLRPCEVLLAVVACLVNSSEGRGAWTGGDEKLDETTYKTWLDFILPKPAELQWQAPAWRPTLWDAVVEGHQVEKPILLWAMNGHPLACT